MIWYYGCMLVSERALGGVDGGRLFKGIASGGVRQTCNENKIERFELRQVEATTYASCMISQAFGRFVRSSAHE